MRFGVVLPIQDVQEPLDVLLDQLRAEIADWRARTGMEYLALRMRQPGGPGHEATLTALARFGEEIIGPMGGTQ